MDDHDHDENKFKGNFKRDQVEVSLDKFINVLNELNQLKLQIREKELEEQSNKLKKGIELAKIIDSWRIFPRIFIGVYMYLLYESATWFSYRRSMAQARNGRSGRQALAVVSATSHDADES